MRRSYFAILLYTALLVPTSARGMDRGLVDLLAKFHGHTCPGSLMGARMGAAARASLEALGCKGKLKARCFSQNCAVDGVQVMAGTTMGTHAIEIEDRNEMAVVLTHVASGRQVEARITKLAREKGKMFRRLRERAGGQRPDSAAASLLKGRIERILDWFREAPDEDVVVVRILE